ncbi:MAG: hypothetical protein FWG91_10295 [Lachnospiraceae bacterium]|nr:hypothetical protein [Lachnospiraceae bacterium]
MGGFKEIMLDAILFYLGMVDANVLRAAEILSANLFSPSGDYGGMLAFANSIQAIIRGASVAICAVCFLIQFIKLTVEMSIMKWEYLAKVLFGLVLARAAMDIMGLLLAAIYQTAAGWIAGAWNNAGGDMSDVSSVIGESIKFTLDEMSWAGVLGFVFLAILPILAVVLMSLAIQVMAYARMFEIFFLVSVAPIACAFIPLEGNRIFKQFAFRFAGTALSGLAIIICIRLYSLFVSSLVGLGGGSGLGAALGALFALLLGIVLLGTSIMKSGQWSKALFDAA